MKAVLSNASRKINGLVEITVTSSKKTLKNIIKMYFFYYENVLLRKRTSLSTYHISGYV